MAEYKGSASEARKAKALEKQRQEQQAEFERLKQKAKEENAVSGVRTIGKTTAHVSVCLQRQTCLCAVQLCGVFTRRAHTLDRTNYEQCLNTR